MELGKFPRNVKRWQNKIINVLFIEANVEEKSYVFYLISRTVAFHHSKDCRHTVLETQRKKEKKKETSSRNCDRIIKNVYFIGQPVY